MTSGGARLRGGPAKDPNALRRQHDKVEWLTLPASRDDPTPDWPLVGGTKRELILWQKEWTRPQAVMWEAAGQFTEVAMYVRQLARCERPKASPADRNLLQRQMGDLGLTQIALAKFLWRIDGPQTAVTSKARNDGRKSAKARFKIIEGEAV